ncbi:hypothetical protein ARMSODRAFT_979229 [Armillaria solidipes]|uniref:Uncharacterized protein n=1 Tax=Armillaria solidipes TaxID=1076256 RepID=A0A2H3B0J6_9AGAR|nr:hypothetical protein ARMSODRAFT_979229 [Armillaria solidipes]
MRLALTTLSHTSTPRQRCEIAHHENVRVATLDSFSESGDSSISNVIWFIPLSIQIVVIQSILVIRVWAMMDKDRRILLTFFGLLFSTTITALALFILLNPLKTPNHSYLSPEAFFEICLVAAAAYRGIKHLRNSRVLKLSYTSVLQRSPRPIMWLMFRDSALYFFLL